MDFTNKRKPTNLTANGDVNAADVTFTRELTERQLSALESYVSDEIVNDTQLAAAKKAAFSEFVDVVNRALSQTGLEIPEEATVEETEEEATQAELTKATASLDRLTTAKTMCGEHAVSATCNVCSAAIKNNEVATATLQEAVNSAASKDTFLTVWAAAVASGDAVVLDAMSSCIQNVSKLVADQLKDDLDVVAARGDIASAGAIAKVIMMRGASLDKRAVVDLLLANLSDTVTEDEVTTFFSTLEYTVDEYFALTGAMGLTTYSVFDLSRLANVATQDTLTQLLSADDATVFTSLVDMFDDQAA